MKIYQRLVEILSFWSKIGFQCFPKKILKKILKKFKILIFIGFFCGSFTVDENLKNKKIILVFILYDLRKIKMEL
jgi:hypothetical protein